MWSPRMGSENTPQLSAKEERNADPSAHDGPSPASPLTSPLLSSIPLTAPAPTTKAPRLLSLDLMRGSIMIIMAWDHCKVHGATIDRHISRAHVFVCVCVCA